MKRIKGRLVVLLVALILPVMLGAAQAAPIAGHEVTSTVPVHLRYQFYEGVGGGTTLEVDVEGDLGREPMNGYITNNGAADVYLHINYTRDAGDTMNKIKITNGASWNFSPASIKVETLELTSASAIDVDILVH